MSNLPILSICIPTFNRGKLLNDLLSSLEPQLSSDIEVVISDNASTDDTSTIISYWSTRIKNFVYQRSAKNLGADMNYLNVVAAARGEYCWFIGSDDIADPDAISKIRFAITRYTDCLLFERLLCTADMKPFAKHRSWTLDEETVFDFSTRDFCEYLRLCTSITGLFSYLSSIVFRRSKWNEVSSPRRLVGSAYVHADILIRLLVEGGSLFVSPQIIVNCRCGNDSFSDGNKGKRLSLDFEGYQLIASELPFDCRLELMRVLVREHPWRNLLHIFKYQSSLGRREEFLGLLTSLGVGRRSRCLLEFMSYNFVFRLYEELIEPWQKKQTPMSRIKRHLGILIGVSTR